MIDPQRWRTAALVATALAADQRAVAQQVKVYSYRYEYRAAWYADGKLPARPAKDSLADFDLLPGDEVRLSVGMETTPSLEGRHFDYHWTYVAKRGRKTREVEDSLMSPSGGFLMGSRAQLFIDYRPHVEIPGVGGRLMEKPALVHHVVGGRLMEKPALVHHVVGQKGKLVVAPLWFNKATLIFANEAPNGAEANYFEDQKRQVERTPAFRRWGRPVVHPHALPGPAVADFRVVLNIEIHRKTLPKGATP